MFGFLKRIFKATQFVLEISAEIFLFVARQHISVDVKIILDTELESICENVLLVYALVFCWHVFHVDNIVAVAVEILKRFDALAFEHLIGFHFA